MKEFAVEIGIDVKKLDGRAKRVRMRAKKLKMPGGEISVPCHKTAEQVKADWEEMIQSGRLTLGEPCALGYQTETAQYTRKIYEASH